MEYRPLAWDVSPLSSTSRDAVTVGPRTPFSPERQVGVRNFVVDSLSYPERNELAVNLVDTATMAPGIDETSNRESGTYTRADTDGRQQLPSVLAVEILWTDIDGRRSWWSFSWKPSRRPTELNWTDSRQRRLINNEEYELLGLLTMSGTLKRRKKLLLLTEKHRQWKNRSCWIRWWLERRSTLGFSNALVPELMREDSAEFQSMFRMDMMAAPCPLSNFCIW